MKNILILLALTLAACDRHEDIKNDPIQTTNDVACLNIYSQQLEYGFKEKDATGTTIVRLNNGNLITPVNANKWECAPIQTIEENDVI